MRTAVRSILLFCISTTYAQTPVRQQPRFALEIAEDGVPSRFVIVPEEPRGGEIDARFFDFHLLPGREAGNSEQSQPSAVRVVSKVDGDEVSFTASVIFGPFDQNDTNRSLEGHPQRSIGSYSAHLNESITLQSMEQFGLQPWTIKIVNAQLSGPASLPMVNEVPSIQPEILGKDRQGYRIALHNISSQAVTAFVVEETLDHNSEAGEFGGRAPLIAIGESHEFRLFCDTSGSASSSSEPVPGPAPCAFILKAALFADGSYEGDAGAAAVLAAPSIAAQFQHRRVHDLIDKVLADASLDDASRLSRIRSELPKLSGEPPPELLEQIQIRFPGLTPEASDRVNASINMAFAHEEQNTLRALNNLEQSPSQSPLKKALAQWLVNDEK
jgi:hypothetical protein